jgi:hypothetical protein
MNSGYKNRQLLTLTFLACTALILGTSVYVFDRPVDSARLIPSIFHAQYTDEKLFGRIGFFLPSLLHIYAFILFTVVTIKPTAYGLLLTCLSWFGIEAIFECLQHPLAAQFIAQKINNTILNHSPFTLLQEYAASGVFDPKDILGLGIGAVAAFTTVALIHIRKD